MHSSLALLQMEDSGIGIVALLFWLAICAAVLIGFWKVFEKAGKPGWGCIIPIYNLILLLEIAGRPLWWIVLYIVPVVNVVIGIMVSLDIARKFGKGTGFGIGLALLAPIFYPVLGFGDAKYQAGA